jgi:hypothetical protein
MRLTSKFGALYTFIVLVEGRSQGITPQMAIGDMTLMLGFEFGVYLPIIGIEWTCFRPQGSRRMSMVLSANASSRKDLTGPALRTFFRIADAWGLKPQQQMRLLGLDSRSTLRSWKRGAVAAVSKDTIERISYVVAIYQGLHILLPGTADEWVRKPNKAAPFAGRSALDRMVAGNVADLYVVRQYVDRQCR